MPWAPQACTLPTAQVPLRVAEFDDLFSQTLRHTERLDVTWLRLVLTGGDATEAAVRDLTAAESRCCSFFDFHIDRHGDQVVLEVRVPRAMHGAPDAAALDDLVAITATTFYEREAELLGAIDEELAAAYQLSDVR